MICSECVNALVRESFEKEEKVTCLLDGVTVNYRVVKCSGFKRKDLFVPFVPDLEPTKAIVEEAWKSVEKLRPGRKLGWRKKDAVD